MLYVCVRVHFMTCQTIQHQKYRVLGLLLPWLPNVFLFSVSPKYEDKTMNRGNWWEAELSETCLTVLY